LTERTTDLRAASMISEANADERLRVPAWNLRRPRLLEGLDGDGGMMIGDERVARRTSATRNRLAHGEAAIFPACVRSSHREVDGLTPCGHSGSNIGCKDALVGSSPRPGRGRIPRGAARQRSPRAGWDWRGASWFEELYCG